MSHNPGQKSKVVVHKESLEIGIRLGSHAVSNTPASDDFVRRVVEAHVVNSGLELRRFPLDALEMHLGTKGKEREIKAHAYLQQLLHHCGDVCLLSNDQLEALAEKSWELVACMERQQKAVEAIETLGKA